MKKILVIYNPQSGKNSRRKKSDSIVEALSRGGNEVTLRVTERRGHATELAKEGENYDVIAVAGGDGTLNEALCGLAGMKKKPSVLYIPSGTTNQTAIAFGLPTKLEDCADLLENGEEHEFDLGNFNERIFIDVCSFGYGTESSLTTPQKLKNKFGFKAFYFNQLKFLFKIRPEKIKVVTDEEEFEDYFVFGNLLNANMVSTFVKIDDSYMDDGYLDFVLVKKLKSVFNLLGTFIKLLRKKFDGDKLRVVRAKKFDIYFDGEMTWLIDGERYTAKDKATVTVSERCFKLFVPKK